MADGSATYTFTPNPEGIHFTFGDPDGVLGIPLTRLCNRIVATAQGRANVDTGLMRSSIRFTVESDEGGEGLIGVVTAHTDYSYYVHEGTIYYEGNPFLEDAMSIELGKGLA